MLYDTNNGRLVAYTLADLATISKTLQAEGVPPNTVLKSPVVIILGMDDEGNGTLEPALRMGGNT